MFESTAEAQALDGDAGRVGTLSAAAVAHLGIGLAIVAVTAIIVPPVATPEPRTVWVIPIINEIPRGEPSPVQAPRPPKGNPNAGDHSQPVAPTPKTPMTQPVATPDRIPEAPPADAGPDDHNVGPPGDPDGQEHGVPGSNGTSPFGDGTDNGGNSPFTLTGEIERPVLLSKVEPAYPTTARMARMTGRVTIDAVIGLDGGVESAEVSSSTSTLFNEAALDAVRHWKYRPALMNGRPVRVYFKVAVEFVLR